jgi:tryptophan synthase beta chain
MRKTRITSSEPDEHGHWGKFGGRYVPETLVAPLEELTNEFTRARHDKNFWRELNLLLRDYAGRPTPLVSCSAFVHPRGRSANLSQTRRPLHTGAHKINNALGQRCLRGAMGKHRVIAETGAGQHGVATATVCALLDCAAWIYMGAEDVRRQALERFPHAIAGRRCDHRQRGTRTLKDAINEALRDWVTNVHDTYYLLGSALDRIRIFDGT